MEKVFVLTIEWCIDGESGNQAQVFGTIDKARAALKSDYDDMLDDYGDWTTEFDSDCAEIYLDGEFNINHCSWSITECPIL